MSVSCIIPAYNEAPRIGAVLDAASACPLIDEIIVVDDCSTDDTASVVSRYQNVKLIRSAVNQGKSKSVCDGMKASHGEIIFFLDADLLGLTPENISDLLRPVISGSVTMTLSLRDTYPYKDRLSAILGIDHLSGERAFHREILMPYLEEISRLKSLGLETFINRVIVQHMYPIRIVPWKNVVSPVKSYKYHIPGFLAEPKFFFGLWKSVFQVASPLEVIHNIRVMKQLNKTGVTRA